MRPSTRSDAPREPGPRPQADRAGEAVQDADGRLEPEAVQSARAVTEKAGARLGLGVETTVVALRDRRVSASRCSSMRSPGPSSRPSDAAGRRRPRVEQRCGATARIRCWTGSRSGSAIDSTTGLNGLLLLDLPDFDSVESAHRLEVDRVVALADLVVWVVEPQKYADASARPLSATAADARGGDGGRPEPGRSSSRRDRRRAPGRLQTPRRRRPGGDAGARRLGADGRGARSLRRLLTERIAARDAAVSRLAADVTAAARKLGECGGGPPAGPARRPRAARCGARGGRRRPSCRTRSKRRAQASRHACDRLAVRPLDSPTAARSSSAAPPPRPGAC